MQNSIAIFALSILLFMPLSAVAPVNHEVRIYRLDELPEEFTEEFINEVFRRQFGGEEGQTPAEIMTERVAELHEAEWQRRAYEQARARVRSAALVILPLCVLLVGAIWQKMCGRDKEKAKNGLKEQ